MRVLSCLLLLTLAFAGCSDGGGDDPTGSPTPTSGAPTTGPATTPPSSAPTSAAPSTSPPATGENRPPTAQIVATVEEGTFRVVFDLTGTDPDGDALSWQLDAESDGEADAEGDVLPAEVPFTYDADGNYTATLFVTDGEDDTETSVHVVLAATGGAASQAVEAEWPVGNGGCGGPYDPWVFGGPSAGVTHAEFDVDPATIGLPFVAEVSSASPLGGLTVDFYDADGARIDGALGVAEPVVGTVPEGAVLGLLMDCFTAGPVTATYRAAADAAPSE